MKTIRRPEVQSGARMYAGGVKHGGENRFARVYVTDELDPESVAMAQALYSRSSASIEGHIDRVLAKGSQDFMRSYYVGYNHKSIADCGSTTIAFENVSMLAAKAIQDWSLYSGQETSSRFLDMGERAVMVPVDSNEAVAWLGHCMGFYRAALEPVEAHVRAQHPKRPDDDPKQYEGAVKARTFDICRGYLPAGVTTQLSWHTNLRQAADHLTWLKEHPLAEVRALAAAAEGALVEAYPASFGAKGQAGVSGVTGGEEARAEWLKKAAEAATYHRWPDATPLDQVLTNVRVNAPMLFPHNELLRTRPRGAVLPHFFSDTGLVSWEFDLDFGSFRDVQRHRNGVCRMPVLSHRLGFEPFYLQELPLSLVGQAKELVDEAGWFCQGMPELERQYYMPMGFRVRCLVSYGLPAAIYVVEQRSQRTVHPTLRRRALEMARGMLADLPDYVAVHLDKEPSFWTVRRGAQTIYER